jgi:serine/threonine protein kinase
VRYTLGQSCERTWLRPKRSDVGLRYQRQTLYSDHSGVKTFNGLDPLTGLPVLIYEFAGKPDPALADLESENIPGVLDAVHENGKGTVVVAYSKGYTPAARPLKLPAIRFVLESAQALSDAAKAGVVHGDLRPERFLVGGNHVLLEGFGLPWVVEPHAYSPAEGVASYAGDVYAFGKIMQELCPELPVPIKTLLDRCLVRKPEDRPSAAQLLTALTALHKPPYGQVQSSAEPQSSSPQAKPNQAKPNQPKPSQAAPAQPASFQPAPQPPLQATPQQATSQQATSQQPPPQQKVLEIDFNVTEDEPPAPPVMPPINLPPVNAKAGTLPDMPELDLFPEDVQEAAKTSGPPLKQPVSLDNWDDEPNDGLLLETDSGSSRPPVTSKSSIPTTQGPNSSLPQKTSGKLPESGPKRDTKKIDPKQTFIKDLPPGGTYKAGKATDIKAAPFKETPMAPTFDDVFLKDNKSSKNTLRIVMVIGLLLGALILAGLVFFRTDGIRPAPTETNSVASYIVSVNVEPNNLPPLDLLVVSSPEGSKFRAGSVVSKVPGQIVLDRAGTWQFQGRFQDELSETVALQLPEQYSLTIAMPDLVPPTEGEETPEESETTETPATTEGQ